MGITTRKMAIQLICIKEKHNEVLETLCLRCEKHFTTTLLNEIVPRGVILLLVVYMLQVSATKVISFF
jgi:hypothetical protein